MAKGQSFAMGVAVGILLGAAVTYQWRTPPGVPAEEVEELRLSLLETHQRASLLEEVARGHREDAEHLRAELARLKGE